MQIITKLLMSLIYIVRHIFCSQRRSLRWHSIFWRQIWSQCLKAWVHCMKLTCLRSLYATLQTKTFQITSVMFWTLILETISRSLSGSQSCLSSTKCGAVTLNTFSVRLLQRENWFSAQFSAHSFPPPHIWELKMLFQKMGKAQLDKEVLPERTSISLRVLAYAMHQMSNSLRISIFFIKMMVSQTWILTIAWFRALLQACKPLA